MLKAAASPIRYRVLLALSQGPATWTQLAHLVFNSEPFDVGGKLGYHVRELLKAGLIAQRPDGRYELTALGHAVLDFIAWLNSQETPCPALRLALLPRR